MTVLGFAHNNLRAPQAMIERLRTFYCEVVGLRVGPRPPFRSRGYWLYAGEHDVLHLTIAPDDEPRAGDTPTTFDHAAFRCRGLDVYRRRLAELGIAYEVDEVPLTGQVQLFLKDPAGNGVELNFAATDR
ncbi:VOC family protein [Rehaibacterium terrae]|jgi:catechol-2,3-dioxygenase|uniref:Catechol-2,3-dioxygenase n=1 Tax=Rehaibacterium terrae TaxID=1341696 RepID=A0A7W7XYP8_9GAMM|nr:VOC family protein [Rehaibacterium terrae]MBB5014872.1 catechol-2,3-dioxygenase [Rehaibacterium terrae]